MDDLAIKLIGVLIAILLSILAYETHRLLGEIKAVVLRQKQQRRELKDFIRTMFTLMARLYPDKAELITKEMQRFLLSDLGGDDADSPWVSGWRQASDD
jgi:hypothetical protein